MARIWFDISIVMVEIREIDDYLFKERLYTGDDQRKIVTRRVESFCIYDLTQQDLYFIIVYESPTSL